jgi:xylan 1,4-beta-xylosidase
VTAREDWEARIGRQRAGTASDWLPAAPASLVATSGRGHVTLDWPPVEGAIGYQVYRDGAPLDHHGGDVLAVPHPPYTDTTGDGTPRRYTVAALADVGVAGPPSPEVEAAPVAGTGSVRLAVDAARVVGPVHRPWRPMIGSEHLSHLLSTETTGGRPIGAELTEALRLAHDELGAETVRAHAILCDDVGVYREVGGRPVYDFSRVDVLYDRLLELGLRPVVELSFMPRDLARDPDATVFAYRAIVSPPKDWDRWGDLVRALARHLIDRYGLAEVRDRWSFEVWNEANLDVFWAGTREEYLQLYDVTARAVKDVHPELRVGGPSSAAAGWVGDLLAHVEDSGAPVDFVSTHTYGSPPLDFRPLCARHGRPDLETWWTEWGVTPTHFNPAGDGVFSATFLLRGMRSAAGRIPALSYWVASDHFEELGRPQRLFHGGFGLLTVGNLRKPRYWALALLERLGNAELFVDAAGDGVGGLVETWAARHSDGTVGVLVWNGTLDQSKVHGAAELGRQVRLSVGGLTGTPYVLRHWRVDGEHSNIAAVWEGLGGGDWPDWPAWAALRERDVLDTCEPARTVAGGTVEVDFHLPMPGISYVELSPAG